MHALLTRLVEQKRITAAGDGIASYTDHHPQLLKALKSGQLTLY